ncbi:MAG: sulfotransferase [Bacteroidetes bacterium]|nr:sulfotransferase [Bacteroidota bacterium]
MKYFSASFYYMRYRVLFRIVGAVCRQFSLRVWLLSLLFFPLFFLHQVVSMLFRALDEVFHRGYKTTPLQQPVFIIANPRSGTTYLHRLIALDEEQFVYTKNAHTFFMASSFVQFYNVCRWVDTHLLRGLIRRLIARLDILFWGGWDDIHPMGFNKAEEDELVFAQMLMSGGIYIPFPFFHLHHETKFLDREPATVRRQVMDFYESSIRRFVFRAGKDKTYLAKNVFSTARFKTLLQRFPDAKVIYIARHPYDAVPSMASMFTILYSKKILGNAPPRMAWAQYGIDFYKYAKELRSTIPAAQLAVVKYDDLLTDPQQTVQAIYEHFNWTPSAKFLERLSREQARNSHYKSAHEYSLEAFGLSKAQLNRELGDVMDEFGFERES